MRRAVKTKVMFDGLVRLDRACRRSSSRGPHGAARITVTTEQVTVGNTFGVRDQSKEWFFKSYLTGRSYCVIYGGGTSATVLATRSVPQGSVLGPLLFILYTAELADLATEYGVKLRASADDSQLHDVHCDLSNVSSSVTALEQCISAISHWMSANRLKT